jgi:Holliday junction DNA helicase RuvB
VTVQRLQTPGVLDGEDELDRSVRPRTLREFVGQDGLREQLAVSIEAAAARGEALDHVLLAGPPGLGKTSLAQIIAAELDVAFVQTAGPALERKGDIAALLTALEPRSVFFVDEVHRLDRALEETFYPAMEDRRLPITIGQGAGAKVVTLELPPFTLIGATTRAGLLTTPLRDRFGIHHRLEPYRVEDLARIVRRSAAILDVALADGGAGAIAARSRERRAWPTACSGGCATGPRCAAPAWSTTPPPTRRWRCWKSTSSDSTASTARSSRPSARTSPAVPSASRRWPSR